MAKRPSHRKNDRVVLSPIKRPIPAHDGKPFVGRDTVLTISHLTGTGSNRNPWHVVVTDGIHFWGLEPDDVVKVDESSHAAVKRDLDGWLLRHGYAKSAHSITAVKRRSLASGQFALPPGPEEKQRGIAGRLPIDTIARARNALARAAQMKKSGHISAAQLTTVRRKVKAAWPSIEVES